MRRIDCFLLSIVMGSIYLYSAYSKIYPIEPFEMTFVDLGVANWKTAPFIARLMIGIEFFVGALFITHLRIKLASKISFSLLTFFTFYLVFILATQGNNGNCGCFGNAIQLTPLQGILKNILMLGLNVVIWFRHEPKLYVFIQERIGLSFFRKYLQKILLSVFFILAMLTPHILNYVDLDYSSAYLSPPENHFQLELDSLYRNAQKQIPPPTLSKGKHVLVLMSLTCPHCRIAAKKIRLMKERNPTLDFYFVLNGDDDKIQPFFDDTKAASIPWCMLLGKNFVLLARGTNMPAIYLMNNGIVEARLNYQSLEQTEIENWFSK
jgi:hypothetical protein